MLQAILVISLVKSLECSHAMKQSLSTNEKIHTFFQRQYSVLNSTLNIIDLF